MAQAAPINPNLCIKSGFNIKATARTKRVMMVLTQYLSIEISKCL